MGNAKQVTRQSFNQEVLQSSVPVLVDFYADWCGPCRMLSPTLERLTSEFAGRAKVVKVNIDSEPELASQFQVSSIPTLVFVADGKLVARTTGLASEAGLRSALNQLTSALSTANRHAS